jgi:aminodeoxyfutalosine synthase
VPRATDSSTGSSSNDPRATISNDDPSKNTTGLPLPLLDPHAPVGQPASPAPAYELSPDDVIAQAREAYAAGATEVHIVGGLHPKLAFEYYLDMCRGIRAAAPGMHIKAFTAIEIIHFTRITKPRLTIRQVLEQLREAGLGSLPGGGAEIFDDRVHAEAYKNKVGEAGWFDVHRTAHDIGMYTNATMLYGHLEHKAERITHLIKLRAHQDESIARGGAKFNCLIPLSFIPDNSELDHMPGPTGLDDLKTLAISRLMLDNVPHIKAFWIMQSAKLAQVALNWGCDDLDGTVVYYDITKREGGAGNTHQELTVDRMRAMIREAGRVPVERDTLYRPIHRDGLNWFVASDPAVSNRAVGA